MTSFTLFEANNPANFSISSLRQTLEQFAHDEKKAFIQGEHACDLIKKRARFIDALLKGLWQHLHLDKISDLSLIAVGGYGRCELHPLSDIDILILSQHKLTLEDEDKIGQFVAKLWDLRLDVGHSVRTLSQCLEIGQSNVSVATNLLESRFICGNLIHFQQLTLATESPSFWPIEDFFQAKLEEQKNRHAKYNNTSYNLEPDIKSTPGGLRDIHLLNWIARRHFKTKTLKQMNKTGFLTQAEYTELLECLQFLWQIRFALHLQLKRYDNRLTFAYQGEVAQLLGFTGEYNQPIEKMMKVFFRTLRRVLELNSMLMLVLHDIIYVKDSSILVEKINSDFQKEGSVITACDANLFQKKPEAMLDLFLHIANDSKIKNISPQTIRQLRAARRNLTAPLCKLTKARECFLAICRHKNSLSHAMPWMHHLGIFSAYIPQWANIVGQMQFDLFHVYTVDEHTVRLLQHFNTFNDPDNQEIHPICCDIYPKIDKHYLLTITALFHDIAKGRGGNHAILGSEDVYDFCIKHQLSIPDAKLASWLVKNHLLMSVTAQRRDIYDPEVVKNFAKAVQTEERLDYLMCLTVADIYATNPELWNNWKRTLLSELFHSTQKTIRQGFQKAVDIRTKARHNQYMASANLRKQGVHLQEIKRLWKRFKTDYFLRHTYHQISWHTSQLLKNPQTDPLILFNHSMTRGGTELFVYTKDKVNLFALIASVLEKRNLTIHDAQILTSKDGYAIDTLIVLDHKGKQIDKARQEMIKHELTKAIQNSKLLINKIKKTPRNLSHFIVETQVKFIQNSSAKKTIIELVALDVPGLLAHISRTFVKQEINLHNAKITTIGEKAEDLFIITSKDAMPLTKEEESQLTTALVQGIDHLISCACQLK